MKKLILALLIFTSCAQTAKKEAAEATSTLEYLVRTPATPSIDSPTLILLHGFGSNERDLFELEQYILPEWLVISVRAPLTMSEGKYMWYSIEGTSENKVQAESSRQELLRFIEYITQKYKVRNDRLVVGGFSQGGIMSLGLGLSNPEKLNSVACFSGRLLDYIKEEKLSTDPSLQSLNVFISHGTEDNIINVKEARDAIAFLDSLGISPIAVIDESNHTLSSEHFNNFGNWLVTEGLK